MGKRWKAREAAWIDVLLTIGRTLTRFDELRAGSSAIEGALDDCQRMLDDVRTRNQQVWSGRRVVGDLSEEDWLTWDCCQGRIDATVEACRCDGARTVRGRCGSIAGANAWDAKRPFGMFGRPRASKWQKGVEFGSVRAVLPGEGRDFASASFRKQALC